MNAGEQKRDLIETALSKLQDANVLDERPTLHVDKWTAWYDEVIPLVTDIKVLSGAMEVELALRRGQQLVAQGERRGRGYELSPGERSSHAEEIKRSHDRMLGRDPAAVTAYIQTEAKAGRVPTRKGAVRHVTGKRKAAGAKNLIRPKAARPGRPEDHRQRILAALATVADGVRRTDAGLHCLIGTVPDDFIRFTRFIPWVTIDRTPAGTRFTIDAPLRTLCETWAPRPELEGESLAEFFATLRREITRRRKENHDARGKRQWSTEMTNQAEQTRLLDWVETQLDRVPLLAPPVPRRHITVVGGSHVPSVQRER